MQRPFISIIIGTARTSYGSIRCDTSEHLFKRTFESLKNQTEQNFELVIADSLFKKRDLADELKTFGDTPFRWSVVPVVSWWLDRQMWALQATFNAGAVASRGLHLMFAGDCCEFPPDCMARCTKLLEQGYDPHLVCIHRTNGFIPDYREALPTPAGEYRTVEDLKSANRYTPEFLYGSTPHGDTRLGDPMMVANGCIRPEHASWQWFYGYGFVRREDFFTLNGWNELFDGEKSLGDVELGSRLEQSGRLHFYMERDLVVYEEKHFGVDLQMSRPTVRSNYDLIWLHRFHNITRAHTTLFSESDLMRSVRGKLTGIHSWPLSCDVLPDDIREVTRFWIDNQPIFRLDDYCAGM